MIIESRFAIGQRVWYKQSRIIVTSGVIDTIHFYKNGKCGYEFTNNSDIYFEDEIYPTRQLAEQTI